MGEFIAPTSAGLNLEHLSPAGRFEHQLVYRMAVSFQQAPAVLPVHLFFCGRHPCSYVIWAVSPRPTRTGSTLAHSAPRIAAFLLLSVAS